MLWAACARPREEDGHAGDACTDGVGGEARGAAGQSDDADQEDADALADHLPARDGRADREEGTELGHREGDVAAREGHPGAECERDREEEAAGVAADRRERRPADAERRKRADTEDEQGVEDDVDGDGGDVDPEGGT
ncbi:hypothetical protein [Haloplanus litoreus]|uniref:Uncharacterized protein n=1 Tax=Haloplanus litoreus TaxID=767515 RepID=A0ABD5ZUP3_9EURY